MLNEATLQLVFNAMFAASDEHCIQPEFTRQGVVVISGIRRKHSNNQKDDVLALSVSFDAL